MLDSNVRAWINENPMKAENLEDLSNWAAEQFELTDEAADEAFQYAKRAHPFMPK